MVAKITKGSSASGALEYITELEAEADGLQHGLR